MWQESFAQKRDFLEFMLAQQGQDSQDAQAQAQGESYEEYEEAAADE